MTTISTWWKATAIAPGAETLTAIFEHEGSPATLEAEAARLLLQQWTPGRLVPSAPRGSDNVGRLAAYGVKIVSVEPLGADHASPSSGGKPTL